MLCVEYWIKSGIFGAINIWQSCSIFFHFIEFVGVTLINKITQVSDAQFYTAHPYTVSCAYHPKCSLCPSPFMPPYLLPPPPLSPTSSHHIIVCVQEFFLFLLNPFTPQDPQPPPQQLSACSLSLSLLCLLVHFVY